jgi:hypothetical protein
MDTSLWNCPGTCLGFDDGRQRTRPCRRQPLGRTASELDARVSGLTDDVRNINRTNARDTDALIDTLQAVRRLEERVARLEGPSDHPGELAHGD